MNKIHCKTKQWVLFIQQCFSGKDKDLLPGKTSFPLCNSRAACSRLLRHSRLSTPDLGQGQPNARSHRPLPRAALAPTGLPWVQPGVSWRAVHQATDTFQHWFSSAEHNWENDGPFTHRYSLPMRVWERCYWGNDLPALCVCFNLNLSVTLAHLVKINMTRRFLWCTQDACGLFPIPVRGWEECANSRNPSEPVVQQPLPHHSPTSTHTG